MATAQLLSARGVKASLVVALVLVTLVAAKKDKGPAVDIQAWYVPRTCWACLMRSRASSLGASTEGSCVRGDIPSLSDGRSEGRD
jgi:hypothetical protein